MLHFPEFGSDFHLEGATMTPCGIDNIFSCAKDLHRHLYRFYVGPNPLAMQWMSDHSRTPANVHADHTH